MGYSIRPPLSSSNNFDEHTHPCNHAIEIILSLNYKSSSVLYFYINRNINIFIFDYLYF